MLAEIEPGGATGNFLYYFVPRSDAQPAARRDDCPPADWRDDGAYIDVEWPG